MTTEHMIHGIASSERIVPGSRDADGSASCVMLRRGCALLTPVPLLLEHRGDEIGRIVYLRWLDGGLLYCRARIHDTADGQRAWGLITEYRARGLSCSFARDHYEIQLRKEGIVKFFDRYRIQEISIVRSPLNQDCVFAVFRGGLESRIASQLSFSEHRQINDRARKLLAQLEKEFPSKPSRQPMRRPAPKKHSPADLQRLWAQRKQSGD